jgi:hypothetical protein
MHELTSALRHDDAHRGAFFLKPLNEVASLERRNASGHTQENAFALKLHISSSTQSFGNKKKTEAFAPVSSSYFGEGSRK